MFFATHQAAIGLLIFVTVVALTLFFFLLYHCWLVGTNVTTAESMRRGHLQYSVKNLPPPTGNVTVRELSAEEIAAANEKAAAEPKNSEGGAAAQQQPTANQKSEQHPGKARKRAGNSSNKEKGGNKNQNQNSKSEPAAAAETETMIIQTQRFGPTNFAAMEASNDARQMALKALSVNPYTKGFFANWRQVLAPPV